MFTILVTMASQYPIDIDNDDDMARIIQMQNDEEIARAIQESFNGEIEDYRSEQEKLDEEMARRLDAEMAQEYQERPQHNHNHDRNMDRPPDNSGMSSDDIDNILDQIRENENREFIKKHGNAFEGKPNIDKILERQNAEIEKMKKDMEMKFKNEDARRLRIQQDEEYEQLLAEHIGKKSQNINPECQAKDNSESEILSAPQTESTMVDNSLLSDNKYEQELEVPRSARELREARLRFYQKK